MKPNYKISYLISLLTNLTILTGIYFSDYLPFILKYLERPSQLTYIESSFEKPIELEFLFQPVKMEKIKKFPNIKITLEEKIEEFSKEPLEKQFSLLEDILPKTEEISRRDMEDIEKEIRQNYNIPRRAYEPIEGIKGGVDFDSLIPYDSRIIKKENIEYYQRILVDKDGRKFIIEKLVSEMTLVEQNNYKIDRMAKKNNYLMMMKRIALGIIDKESKEQKP